MVYIDCLVSHLFPHKLLKVDSEKEKFLLGEIKHKHGNSETETCVQVVSK